MYTAKTMTWLNCQTTMHSTMTLTSYHDRPSDAASLGVKAPLPLVGVRHHPVYCAPEPVLAPREAEAVVARRGPLACSKLYTLTGGTL